MCTMEEEICPSCSKVLNEHNNMELIKCVYVQFDRKKTDELQEKEVPM